MKRMFKSTISLLLIAAFLLTPLVGTTASAVGEEENKNNPNIVRERVRDRIENYDLIGWDNGVYEFENVKTGKYANISGKTSGSGLTQKNDDNSCNQKWYFEEQETGTYEGYYLIRNLETGLYMTVENNSSGDADVILSELTYSTGQYWRTDDTNSGYYKIIPACAESTGKVLTLDSFLGITLNSLVIRSYTDNSDLKDEWDIWKETRFFSIRILYDSTVMESEELIESTFWSAVAPIEKNFGVLYDFYYIGISNNLETSDCYTTNIKNYCTPMCGTDSSCELVHHRGAKRLISIDEIPLNSIQTCRIVGYAICYYFDGGHGGIAGLAQIKGNNTVISTQAGRISSLMSHELSHNLGAPDHQPISENDKCIMTGFNSTKWCESCRTTMFKYLYTY